jgi:thiosulfate/3-mercaptopyruvate sulfurtransferase
MSTTLVTADELAAHLDDPNWRIFDCRHDLQDTGYGEKAYLKGHIPGALFLHLDRDLSGEKTGANGRHPLPSKEAFAAKMAACGVGPETQVVAYDNEGSIFASRLWWMLRWVGHEKVAVLDGGVPCWRRAKREFETVVPSYPPAPFVVRPGIAPYGADDVLERLDDPQFLILDARAPERFSGEEENLDPVGGHVPGAINRFYFDNLDDAGCFFKTADELREEFDAVLKGRAPQNVIQQCGSGVTACHNLLAMEVAGLTGSRLYAGSWSEWCADPSLPIATGE